MKIFKMFTTALLFVLMNTNLYAQKKSPVSSKSTKPGAAITELEELKPITVEKGKDAIAVYHFTSSASYSYDYALSAGNAVEAGFVRSGRFAVVERSRFGLISDEEKFKEANTEAIVKKAAKLSAKTLVTGHVIAVTIGNSRDIFNLLTSVAQTSISFKIIDVETGEIKKSETILGKGTGSTQAAAMQKAYEEIDRLSRAYVAEYLPQRFEYASEVEVDKKGRLQKFKIWGGSGQGLGVGDIIEIYEISYLDNPATGKKVQEKRLRGEAKVKEVNSTETATCELQKYSTTGEQLLIDLRTKSKIIVFEYKGKVKKGGLFN